MLTDVGQMAGAYALLARRQAEATFGRATEEQVVNSWLLARYAQQLGMVVSDQQIIDFLKRWSRNAVKPAEFQAAFKRSGLSEIQFFNLMRDELLAQQIQQMFYVSLAATTPAERWDYFTRVKQMAAIEAVPVPVADYVARVDEPSDEELKAFFDQHKDEYPLPDSPEPGFREPQQVALQWFKADEEKFLAQVTDEEIKQRYEKNKDLYDQSEKQSEAKQPEEKKEKPKESGKKQDSKDSSAAGRPSPFRLTALPQEEKSADQAAAAAKEKKPAASPAPVAKEAPSPKKPAAEGAEKKPASTQKPPSTAKKSAAAKPGLAEATKTRIRREIADEKIFKIFENLREQMVQYHDQWSQYEVAMLHQQSQKENEKKTALPPPPPRPDFEKLAKENGLLTGQTPLVSQWEVRSMPIGASLANGREPVWQYAFLTLAQFRAEISVSLGGDFYLFWKTEETRDRIPKFDDPGVRERVLRTWKMIHARPLAVKAAESLAAEARQAKEPLKQAFAGRSDLHVVLPPPFSWITFGNVPLGSAPNAVRTSDVTGVEYAGDEFMRTVFRLEPGQIGVAMNAPQNVAYVIQLSGLSPSHEVLRKEFEVDDFSKYEPAAMEDRQRTFRAWLDEIKSSAGVEWKRKADQAAGSSGPQEEE